MQRKRLVFVINRLKLGGAQRVMITLAQAFQELGHECHFICFKRSEQICGSESLKIHYFSRGLLWLPPPLRDRFLARKLDAFISQRIGKPDLILSNLSKANRLLVHSKLQNIYIIVHNTLSQEGETGDKSDFEKWTRKRKIRNIYLRKPCVCVSHGVREDFLSLIPEHPAVTVILNPIDVESIKVWSQEYPSPYQDYVVQVGSLIHRKRHDLLLRAYRDSGISESLVLVGDGELEPALKQQARELGIEDRVIFAGFHSNPYPIIAGAKLMVLTSDYEGLGMVLLESLALNVPAISTNCQSGPAEILPPQNLAPVGDVSAIANVLRTAIANPVNHAAPLAEKCNIHLVAKAYLELAGTR